MITISLYQHQKYSTYDDIGYYPKEASTNRTEVEILKKQNKITTRTEESSITKVVKAESIEPNNKEEKEKVNKILKQRYPEGSWDK